MDEALQQHVHRILTDTGYCCRNLLGWNYDEGKDGEKFNVGTGGVRDYGSHQAMVDVLDDPNTNYKLIEAPRGSYKSTILQGFIVRHILLNPDVRIIYVSAKESICNEKALAVRSALESENVLRLFGNQVGDPWEATRFTVASRVQKNLQTPTFLAFSMESMVTGGRGNIVILDDPIDQENCTNAEMLEKSKRNYALIQPFIAAGGILVVVGTRYAEDDLLNDLEASQQFQPPHGRSLILGAGVRVVKDPQTNAVDLVEEPTGLTFPHMTMDFLKQKLIGMTRKGNYREFCCQYLNYVPSGSESTFTRQMFQTIKWDTDMTALSGYLLTDTAVSLKDAGCYSVIAYVGLDAADNIYLLDLRVGHWEQREFIVQFFAVLEEWSQKANHLGEAWEDVALATSFEYSVRDYAQRKKVKLNPLRMKRKSTESKLMRIKQLHTPFHDRQFWVVNTVPRMFDDVDGQRVLFDPEGHFDARTKVKSPGGELVDEFIRLGAAGVKTDIADTIAMIFEHEKNNGRYRRYCSFKPAKKKALPTSLTEDRIAGYRAAHYPANATSGDWWERTLNNIGDGGFQ